MLAGKELSGVSDLDCDFVVAGDGALGVGEVENRGWRFAAGGDVFRGRIRTGNQRGTANGLG